MSVSPAPVPAGHIRHSTTGCIIPDSPSSIAAHEHALSERRAAHMRAPVGDETAADVVANLKADFSKRMEAELARISELRSSLEAQVKAGEK